MKKATSTIPFSLTTKRTLAIICMRFVWIAEKIVKEIFGLRDTSGMGEALQAWVTVKELGNAATKIGGKASSAIANKTQFGKNIVNSPQGQTVKSAINNFKSTKAGGIVTGIVSKGFPATAGVAAAGFE